MRSTDILHHIECPGFVPPDVHSSWAKLEQDRPLASAWFDPDQVRGLPAPVERWLLHAIEPGAPLRFGARLAMHGEIRVGTWQPFVAQQLLAPTGFVWAAEAGHAPVRIRGYDRLTSGTGEMSWRMLGLPVMRADGPDITRSAEGRLAAETLLVPSAALAPWVSWRGIDGHRAVGVVASDRELHEIEIVVDDEGVLRTVTLQRWGNPDHEAFALHTFGVAFDGEQWIDGQHLPATLRAGWWFGSERWEHGEFFRCTIDRVELF